MSLISHNKAFLNKLGLIEAFKLSKGRFKSLSKDQNLFASIQNDIGKISIWDLDKASQLRQYAQNFSMENYNKNLKLFITNWIESHSHLFKNK